MIGRRRVRTARGIGSPNYLDVPAGCWGHVAVFATLRGIRVWAVVRRSTRRLLYGAMNSEHP